MSRILITYASTHGQTEKIARRMAEAIEDSGQDAEVRPVADGLDPSDFDAVAAGASIHAGKHQSEMADWVKVHRDALAARPGAFFSVSLTAAEEDPDDREPATRMLGEFLAETGWEPELSATIAGALSTRLRNAAMPTPNQTSITVPITAQDSAITIISTSMARIAPTIHTSFMALPSPDFLLASSPMQLVRIDCRAEAGRRVQDEGSW